MATKKSKVNRVVGISAATERDWRGEADLNTLIEAEKIKRDAARFKNAQRIAKERLAAVASVAGGDKD